MDVVVIGAGLSGLTTAATLLQAGVDVQLIEADAHAGGRIRALRDPVDNRPLADLGPTWVWPKYQPVASQWLERLGAITFEQYNQGDGVILGFGPSPLRQPLPGQDGMVRIAGGPTALIDTLVERVGDDKILKSTSVTKIVAVGSQEMAVHLNTGEVIKARNVIVSVPLRVAAETIQMPWVPQPLIDEMRKAPTWMSTHAKAVAVFDRPFWRDHGLSGRIASRAGPLVEAHDHSPFDGSAGAIFGFIGWPPERRKNDPAGLSQAILDQLSECFGKQAAEPRALVIQDWAQNPFIASDLDLALPPAHPDVAPQIIREPHLNGRVRFAVSETADVSPGLIEGALASGERAATELLR